MYKKLFDLDKQKNMRDFFLNNLSKKGKLITYKKNDTINHIDINELIIVVSGKVKVITFTISGQEKVLFYLRSGEIDGEISYFGDEHIHSKIIALEDSVISHISYDILTDVISEYPEYYSFFIHSIIRKYRIALSQIYDFLAENPKVRIASTLYRLATQTPKYIDGRQTIDLLLTHQELANLIGCSRVTVTRILKELKNEGIIDTKTKEIYINDIKKLKELSGIYDDE